MSRPILPSLTRSLRHRLVPALAAAVVGLVLAAPAQARIPLRILINQVGYDARGSKKLIVQLDAEPGTQPTTLRNTSM